MIYLSASVICVPRAPSTNTTNPMSTFDVSDRGIGSRAILVPVFRIDIETPSIIPVSNYVTLTFPFRRRVCSRVSPITFHLYFETRLWGGWVVSEKHRRRNHYVRTHHLLRFTRHITFITYFFFHRGVRRKYLANLHKSVRECSINHANRAR